MPPNIFKNMINSSLFHCFFSLLDGWITKLLEKDSVGHDSLPSKCLWNRSGAKVCTAIMEACSKIVAAAENQCVWRFFSVSKSSSLMFGCVWSLGAAGRSEQRKPRAGFDDWPNLHDTLLQDTGDQPQTRRHRQVFVAFIVCYRGY